MCLRICLLLLVFAVAGCGGKTVKDEFVTADQVPAAVTEAADQLFSGFKAEQVWKYEQDGETVYELRGKTPDGKSHETTVSAAGKVLWPVKK